MKYNFELTFEKEIQDKIQTYADKINNILSVDKKLEKNPHITLVKFKTNKEFSNEYREETSSKFSELKIEFSGLKLLPSKDGGTWVEIRILQSEKLRKLINDFCDLFTDIKIVSHINDDFRPHLTLCKLKNQTAISVTKLNYELLRGKFEVNPRLFITGKVF